MKKLNVFHKLLLKNGRLKRILYKGCVCVAHKRKVERCRVATAYKKTFSKSMSFRVVVYPSEFSESYFTAHCLELDVIGQGRTLEGAIAQLLEAIETQLMTCAETGAQFEFWAPGMVWYKYEQARKANRKISDELMERIIAQANQRLGYQSSINLDSIAAGTREVFDECQAVSP